MKIIMYICKVFRKRHDLLMLNFSDELAPQKRLYEQNQYYIEAAHFSAGLFRSSIEAVQGPSENMEGLRFLSSRLLVPPSKR